MTATTIEGMLQLLVMEQKKRSFNKPEKATDEDALGIMVANYCEWDGNKLKKVIYAMLEDANFHTLNAQFKELCEPTLKVVK